MKLKKLTAMLLSLCLAGVSSSLPNASLFMEITDASAANDKSSRNSYIGHYNDLVYHAYTDHIEIDNCSRDAVNVDIPEEIDELPVTVIDKFAFQYCKSLNSVTIPKSVTKYRNVRFLSL